MGSICSVRRRKAVETSHQPAVKKSNHSSRQSKSTAKKIEDSSSGKPFRKLYKAGSTLGEGTFSVVKEGVHRQTGETYAVKIVPKGKLPKEDELALQDEIVALKELNHKHIIRLNDVFEDAQFYYIVAENRWCGCWELFHRIGFKTHYNEKEARDVCRILFDVIAHCHKHQVAHRDLRPESFVLPSGGNEYDLKIAGFRFAKKMKEPNCLTTQCGTPAFVAPEILEGVPYGTQADMWSLGVLVYTLLGGYPPFQYQWRRCDVFRKIRQGQYEFHPEYWGNVSPDGKELVASLLTVNPARRLTAADALKHKWILLDDEKLASVDLSSNLIELRKSEGRRVLHYYNGVQPLGSTKLTSLGVNLKDLLE